MRETAEDAEGQSLRIVHGADRGMWWLIRFCVSHPPLQIPMGHPNTCCGSRDGWATRPSQCWEVYRPSFVATRRGATLLADAPCFAIFACPALVINRDCSYISIHFSLGIAAIRLPIASSGK